MKVREYLLLQRCVEMGVSLGYNRAFKYADEPSEDIIKENIVDAVMNEISNWFIFEESFKFLLTYFYCFLIKKTGSQKSSTFETPFASTPCN